MGDIAIRRAQQGDVAALTGIYNHYVRETAITLDTVERDEAGAKAWFAGFADTGRYQCFVAARGGQPVGWASSHVYNPRAGYDPTVAASIYLAPDATGQGLGRRLYATLFNALAGEDIHAVFGGITLPNEASVGLHRSLGFAEAGIYREVGRKFGRFWDVATFLKAFPGPP
jgi:phosphinothricin acetyltransferase